MKPISFIASIAPLQTAITISSDGGCRIKLDIPQSEEAKFLYMLTLRDTAFKVTIEPMDSHEQRQEPDDTTTTVKRTTAKRRK